jgi:hypothetical protein
MRNEVQKNIDASSSEVRVLTRKTVTGQTVSDGRFFSTTACQTSFKWVPSYEYFV